MAAKLTFWVGFPDVQRRIGKHTNTHTHNQKTGKELRQKKGKKQNHFPTRNYIVQKEKSDGKQPQKKRTKRITRQRKPKDPIRTCWLPDEGCHPFGAHKKVDKVQFAMESNLPENSCQHSWWQQHGPLFLFLTKFSK